MLFPEWIGWFYLDMSNEEGPWEETPLGPQANT